MSDGSISRATNGGSASVSAAERVWKAVEERILPEVVRGVVSLRCNADIIRG